MWNDLPDSHPIMLYVQLCIHSFYKNEMHIYAFLLKQPVLLVERGGKRQCLPLLIIILL